MQAVYQGMLSGSTPVRGEGSQTEQREKLQQRQQPIPWGT